MEIADGTPLGPVDEWVFAAWSPDGCRGVVSGHRLIGARAWYWSLVVQVGYPVLHLTEWDVITRPDPFVVKAPEMWAEHECVAEWEQWSIGNEAFFVALDDPVDAIGRGYGTPTPTACDLEWYAASAPMAIEHGWEQAGVVHGRIEIAGRRDLEWAEAPAWRWRRAGSGDLGPIGLPPATGPDGLRAPVVFPTGVIADWTLTSSGWMARISSQTR